MASYVGRKVECMQAHSTIQYDNKGHVRMRAHLWNANYCREKLMKPDSPICQKCGFKCKEK